MARTSRFSQEVRAGSEPWARKYTDAYLRGQTGRGRRTRFAFADSDGCLPTSSLDRAGAWLSRRVGAGSAAQSGLYSSSSLHIRNTVAAILRARLSFTSEGFVPASGSRA